MTFSHKVVMIHDSSYVDNMDDGYYDDKHSFLIVEKLNKIVMRFLENLVPCFCDAVIHQGVIVNKLIGTLKLAITYRYNNNYIRNIKSESTASKHSN